MSLTRRWLRSVPPSRSETVSTAAHRAGNSREFRRQNTASCCRTSKQEDAGGKTTGRYLPQQQAASRKQSAEVFQLHRPVSVSGRLQPSTGQATRDAHGYPDISINPDNKLSGYIQIINYPFNYPSTWRLILFMYFLCSFQNFYAILQNFVH